MTVLTEEERDLVRKHRFVYEEGIDVLTSSVIMHRNRELRVLIRAEVKALLIEEEAGSHEAAI
jgi:hypothetical protein